ncbi:MAG TPA: hypothetical protein P5298_14245 [Spirochaetia bacterium]|nr:hypothetical protein [Spirochaetia bacterium]
MPKGRTPKTVEEHKKAGTYRKDRHAARASGEAKPAKDKAPPASLPADLHGHWYDAVADLEDIGIVTKTDLAMLERAFVQLGNSMKLQAKFEESLRNDEATPSDMSKFQSATSSATASYLRLVLEVRRAVKLNPKKPAGDPLGEWLGEKK